MSYATPADVEVSLGRSLASDEETWATELIERVERRITRRLPDLTDQIADDPDLEFVVAEVEADVVARVLRNPDGLLSEQDGDYLYTRDRRLASGVLELTAAEWARLGVTSGAFTIAPYLPSYTLEPDTWVTPTEHL